MPSRGQIVDRFGRVFDYLRVAITERCNLRCVYCMPEAGVDFKGAERLLNTEELLRVIRVAAELGVHKVRFTGGEPLVRKDILTLIEQTARTPGVRTTFLTTNGVLLARFAEALRDAGLTGLNISLDTLDEERFKRITRRTGRDQVLASIRQAVELGFSTVKVNVVAMRGFNDDELPAFARLTEDLPITVRFIELMPFDEQQIWKTGCFLSVDRIEESLRAYAPDLLPAEGSSTEARVFRAPGHAGKLAIIPAYTRSICATCDRIRLTADGQIRTCLYSENEHDVLALIRAGGTDDELAARFISAMSAKLVDGWEAQRQSGGAGRTSMTQIGG